MVSQRMVVATPAGTTPSGTTPSGTTARGRTTVSAMLGLRRPHGNVTVLGVLISLEIALGLATWAVHHPFLSSGNLMSISQSTVTIGLGALGMTYLIAAGFFDLSGPGIVAVAATAMGLVYGSHGGWGLDVLSVLVALLVGIAAGTINGVLVALLRVPAFVATLGTFYVYTSVAELATNAGNVSVSGHIPSELAVGELGGVIPIGAIVLIGLAILASRVLWRTRFGRYVRFTGVSQRAAHVWGIPVRAVVFIGFCVAGVAAAAGGVVLGGLFASANAGMATTYNLDTIAAVVVGGTRLEGGIASMAGTVVGSLLFAEVTNVLTIWNVNAYYQYVATGGILVVALWVGGIRLGRVTEIFTRRVGVGGGRRTRRGHTDVAGPYGTVVG